MKTKKTERSNEKYARRSLQNYLEGQNTLNWFVGSMRSAQVDAVAIRQMLADLVSYGLPERHSQLLNWLDSQPKQNNGERTKPKREASFLIRP